MDTYSEDFTIRAAEIDQNGNATLGALASLMQEVAGNHASILNFDITDLQENDLTWVLHRMDMEILRYPKWREKIRIETWPNAGDALRAYRDYLITDANGEVLLRCLSYWMIINMKSRRPSRIPREILELRIGNKDHVLPVKSERPSPADSTDKEIGFRVRRSDLDMNDHVNNARYLEWCLEALEPSTAENIRQADILFMKESRSGEEITSRVTHLSDKRYQHRLINQDGRLIALAETSTDPRKG